MSARYQMSAKVNQCVRLCDTVFAHFDVWGRRDREGGRGGGVWVVTNRSEWVGMTKRQHMDEQ